MNPTWGKTSKERQKSVGAVVSELTIIREQMRHPNVVRYYKTFVERKCSPLSSLSVQGGVSARCGP